MENASNKLGRAFLATSIVVATLLGGAGAAFAQVADPGGSGAGFGQVGTGTESWVSTYGMPVLVTLALLGVGVALFIRWSRKATGIVS